MKPVSSSSSKSPAVQVLTHGLLRVSFAWQADRWEHEVSRIEEVAAGMDGPSPPVATAWQSVSSLPGTEPRWPASPSLVELTPVPTPPGTTLLGLGLAGSSHYSASIGPDPDDADSLRFDMACRITGPGWLGSTYAAAGTALHGMPGVTSGVAVEPLAGSILEQAGTGERCGQDHCDQDHCGPDPGGPMSTERHLIRIRPAALPDNFPATVRWGYRIRVIPPVGRPRAC